MNIKKFASILFLIFATFFAAPGLAQPSGTYHAYLIQNLTPYSDTLTFTANPGTSQEGIVTSSQLGTGEFHYSVSEQMVLMIFSQHIFGAPQYVMAGKLVGGQWQGVLSIDQSNGAVWVAQSGPFIPDPSDFGPSINLAKDSANPQGKVFSGTEWNPVGALSFRLTNSISAAGVVKDFFSGPAAGMTGHFASFIYTSTNSQLAVIGLPGGRVYGAVAQDLGAGVLELKGAWFNSNGNQAGTFLVHH